jgi:hypothetical protein
VPVTIVSNLALCRAAVQSFLWVQYYAFVLSSGNVLESVLEMPFTALNARRILLIGAEI